MTIPHIDSAGRYSHGGVGCLKSTVVFVVLVAMGLLPFWYFVNYLETDGTSELKRERLGEFINQDPTALAKRRFEKKDYTIIYIDEGRGPRHRGAGYINENASKPFNFQHINLAYKRDENFDIYVQTREFVMKYNEVMYGLVKSGFPKSRAFFRPPENLK